MKFTSLVFLATIGFASAKSYAAESLEICTTDGPCGLLVNDTETGENVWLVTDAGVDLQLIWQGAFWLVSNEDYQAVRSMIPEQQRLMLPGINPTTGLTLPEAKGGTAPAGGGKGGSVTGGGPLIGGSITVTVGGDDQCRACHTGSSREIHKKVLGGK